MPILSILPPILTGLPRNLGVALLVLFALAGAAVAQHPRPAAVAQHPYAAAIARQPHAGLPASPYSLPPVAPVRLTAGQPALEPVELWTGPDHSAASSFAVASDGEGRGSTRFSSLVQEPCPCRFHFEAGANVLHRSHGDSVTLAVNQTTLQPVLTTDSLDFGYSTGPYFRLGVLGLNRGMLEVIYFGGHHWAESALALGPSNLSLPPPFGLPPSDYFGARRIRAERTSELHNAELNYRFPVSSLELLVGGRSMDLQEAMRIDSTATGTSSYLVRTDNDLFGGQVGAIARREVGWIGLELFGKAGILSNGARQRTLVGDQGNQVTRRDFEETARHVAFVGEAGVRTTLQLTDWLDVRGGYGILWIEDVALAPGQLDFRAAPASGSELRDSSGVLLHGAHAAMEFHWGGNVTHHQNGGLAFNPLDLLVAPSTRPQLAFRAGTSILHRSVSAGSIPLVIDDTTRAVLISGPDLGPGTHAAPYYALSATICQRGAIEGIYFDLDQGSDSTSVTSLNNLSLPGDLGLAISTFDFNRADTMRVDFSSDFESAELNYRHFAGPVDLLVGCRYLGLSDQLVINSVDRGFGTQFSSDYFVHVDNHLLGGQVGLVLQHLWGRLGIEAFGKAGGYSNSARQRTFLGDVNNQIIRRNFTTTGRHVAFVGDVGVLGTLTLAEWLAVRAGYQFLWLEDVAEALDQLDFGAVAGSGAALRDGSGVYLHGAHLALEFRWPAGRSFAGAIERFVQSW